MSYEATAGLIELVFVYSLALGFGIWQVIKMRRMLAKDREAAEQSRPSNADKSD